MVQLNVTSLGEGAQHGVVLAHTDISTRKLHERLAVERAEQTQFILDNVIDGILTVDRQGTVQSMNRAAQAIFGLQAAQVLGHNVSRLMPEPYRSQLDSFLREVPDADVARITGGVREVQGLRGDGSVFPMDLAVSRGVQRDQPIFIGVVRDVTQRKRAEQALRDSQKRLEAAQLLARMGDWELDLQSGEMHWSKEVFIITGQDPTQFRPSLAAMRAALHPADAHLLRQAMRQAERTGSFDVVHRMRRPDGSLRYVHTLASAVLVDGRVRRLTGAVQDVTEAHQAELTLRQARDAAEKASQAKTEFLSAMSHELRTPMNAMLGFAQLIEYDPGLPDEHKDNAREILKAGYHLLQLINEVLDLSRIESGQLALSLEPVQAGLVVRECLQLVRPMAAHHGIEIGEFDSVNDATVRADRTRLRQVLLNLLSNAVKYNRRGGSVRVELRAHGTERLRILVSDTGVGIAPERQSELFLPFSRLGIEGGNIEGSGIGLNITRRLAEMMGGRVDVESVPGKGSTFWIELTCDTVPEYCEPQAVSETAMSTQRREGPRHRVLYIEDNPANLKLVAQILARNKDIELLTADNPQAGLALASAQRPSLILLDINLPGLDGYQVLARLKADQRLCAIPVVAVTAKAMPRDIERGMAAGFSDYLTKPLDLARFREVVERLLGLGVPP
jgi:PAS domain S-box-containing protein